MNPTDKLILYKNDEFSFILWDFSDFFQNYFRYFSKIQSRFIDFQMSLIQTLFDKRRWIAICTTKYKSTTEIWASELLWAPRYSSVKFPNIVTMSKSSRIKMKTMIHITNLYRIDMYHSFHFNQTRFGHGYDIGKLYRAVARRSEQLWHSSFGCRLVFGSTYGYPAPFVK